jgi:hypothetical protein
MAVLLIDPLDEVLISFDWTDALPAGVLIYSVDHVVTLPLVKLFEDTTPNENLSTCKIKGAVHGGTYLLQATAQLDNGEVINRAATLRCVDA